MNIAVFGTGSVGRTLAKKLIAGGHAVTIGTRDPQETLARTGTDAMGTGPYSEWQTANPQVVLATFAQAAAGAEVILLAANGSGTVSALEAAGTDNVGTKIVIDISNALDFSHGMPPSLFVSNTDSLGEVVQRAIPEARVVKTLIDLGDITTARGTEMYFGLWIRQFIASGNPMFNVSIVQ